MRETLVAPFDTPDAAIGPFGHGVTRPSTVTVSVVWLPSSCVVMTRLKNWPWTSVPLVEFSSVMVIGVCCWPAVMLCALHVLAVWFTSVHWMTNWPLSVESLP